MRLGGAPPNSVTYNTLIDACVRRGEIARARQIVRWLVEGQARGIADRPPPSVQVPPPSRPRPRPPPPHPQRSRSP